MSGQRPRRQAPTPGQPDPDGEPLALTTASVAPLRFDSHKFRRCKFVGSTFELNA